MLVRMISPSSFSAFSVSTPPVAPAVTPSQAARADRVQVARTPAAPSGGPATTTQQLQANPPVHPGRTVPRGSLLDLKV